MRKPFVAALLVVSALAVAPASGQESLAPFSAGGGMTLAEIDDEISRREADLARHDERLRRLESETAEVRVELDARAAELAEQETQVRARIVTLCRLRQGGYLHLLRGADSLSDLVRRARYARLLADHELGLLRQHQERVDELAARRAEVEGRIRAARELRERIATYRDELRQERERRADRSLGLDFDPVTAPVGSPLGTMPLIGL